MTELTESKARLLYEVGDLVLEHSQAIPSAYLDLLKQQQDEFKWNLNGFTKVASVPQALADKWLNEGFNVYKAPAEEIIKRLRMEEFDVFVTAGNRTI